MFDQLAERQPWDIMIKRTRRMMLNPLAEIVVAVLMAVRVGSGQFMLHILRNGKWSQGHEKEDQAERQSGF